jgi:hypothetical protein
MLQMAKELISLHAFVDDTMATLDAIADAQRLQRGANQRQEHVAALETQRLQLSLDQAYTLLDQARHQAANSDVRPRSLTERSHEKLTDEMLSSALDRPMRMEMAAVQASAFAAASASSFTRPIPLAGDLPGKRARGGLFSLGSLELGPVWQGGLILARSSAGSAPRKGAWNALHAMPVRKANALHALPVRNSVSVSQCSARPSCLYLPFRPPSFFVGHAGIVIYTDVLPVGVVMHMAIHT